MCSANETNGYIGGIHRSLKAKVSVPEFLTSNLNNFSCFHYKTGKKGFYVKLHGKTIRNPLCIYNIKLYPLDSKISASSFGSFSPVWRITPTLYYLLFQCLKQEGFIYFPATAWNVHIWHNVLRYLKLRQCY